MSRNFLEGRPIENVWSSYKSKWIGSLENNTVARYCNQLPDAFIYAKGVTKSHISTPNALVKIMAPIDNKRPVKLKTCQKHGQKIVAKDKNLLRGKTTSLRESPKEKLP